MVHGVVHNNWQDVPQIERVKVNHGDYEICLLFIVQNIIKEIEPLTLKQQ